jgi:hypothetical protein
VNIKTIKHQMVRIAWFTAATAAFIAAAQAATTTPTHILLSAETREDAGKTVATFHAAVQGEDGATASGVVVLMERGREVAGAALDEQGKADIVLNGMPAGDHLITALYKGDATHEASRSNSLTIHPETSTAPGFTLALTPATVSVVQGQAGTLVATVTPTNGFTGFVTFSCSATGQTSTLPTGLSCNFVPANLQIAAPSTANPTGAASTDLSIQTSTGQVISQTPPAGVPGSKSGLTLALLLPGIVGLGFLSRKSKRLGRVAMLLAISAIGCTTFTGCAARYRYLHHGPTFGGTPVGSYTINITAQTSNGVTATAQSQPLALTVTNPQ